MRFYLLPLKVVAILFLPATIRGKLLISHLHNILQLLSDHFHLSLFSFKGNLDENNQLVAHNDGRELKKGQFSCGASSPTVYCLKERQLCDTSTGKACCICAEGWKGSRCQNRIDEPPSTLPTKMPTSSGVGSACTLSSDCATDNLYCLEGQCRCQSGFSPRKGSCINVNECEERAFNGCHRDALCIDTEGSYECNCKLGFSDTNPTLPGRQCQQLNECNLGTHNCDAATQVCLDRRPPEKWECVERTPAPTPKPTRPPTPPPTVAPIADCFSGDTTVIMKGRGKVSMRQLKIGDLVLVKANVYEPIIASAHRNFHRRSNFLSITTNSSSDNALEVSAHHIVFLHDRNTPVTSKMLKVGSVLLGSNNEPLEVIKVQMAEKQGVFNPMTASGTIVVNGILCSTYALPMNTVDTDGIHVLFYGQTVMTLHSFHHMRNSPLCLAILGISSRLSYFENKEGQHLFSIFFIHVYFAKTRSTYLWVRVIGHVTWYLLLLLSSICLMLEYIFGSQGTLIFLMLFMVVLCSTKQSRSLL
jgi:Hint module/Calcium-binding EGF domain